MTDGVGALPDVHILGGGVGAITAAFYLSAPGWEDRFASINVHQIGWRLGGKGASGRDAGQDARIEEHGLHVWFGFYENAFRMLDRCHRELDAVHRSSGGDAARARWPSHHQSVDASFHPVDRVGMMEDFATKWYPWVAMFPRRPGMPWDRDLLREPATWSPAHLLPDFLTQLVGLGRSVVGSLEGGFLEERERSAEVQNAIDVLARLLGVVERAVAAEGVRAAISMAASNPAATRRWLDAAGPLLEQTLETLATVVEVIGRRLGRLFWRSEEVRRLWTIVVLVLAVARGLLLERVVDDDAIDRLDDQEFRTWLMHHGATREAVEGPFVRAVVYDLAFAYESGVEQRASCGAGTALRGLHRLLFTYRGAVMWKMNGGMGDVVFMPLYELLTKRGVTFQFFRQITDLGVRGRRVTHIEYRQQPGHGRGVQDNLILVDAGDLGPGLCWRSAPPGCTPEDARKLESTWWRQPEQARERIEVGDRDIVVLGIGLGAVPYVAGEVMARSARWRNMVDNVQTVPTEALQLWLRPAIADLGWEPDAIVGGYGKPFDTWSDMPAPLAAEAHGPDGPRGLAYFCSVFDSTRMNALDPPPDADDVALEAHFSEAWKQADEQLHDDVDAFVGGRLRLLWPGVTAIKDGDRPRLDVEVGRSERVNIDPSDRYVLSVAKSSRHRLHPGDTGFDNLYVAGDWTECTLNAGCVEAAVISGMTAARAIGSTAAFEIIGERSRR